METRIEISGYLVGAIWWPAGAECWKDLHYDLTREDARFSEPGTLRDHVLRAVNDGDFQGCTIAQGALTISVRNGSRKRCRTFSLAMFPSVKDCLHEDPDWFPCCADDDDDDDDDDFDA